MALLQYDVYGSLYKENDKSVSGDTDIKVLRLCTRYTRYKIALIENYDGYHSSSKYLQ